MPDEAVVLGEILAKLLYKSFSVDNTENTEFSLKINTKESEISSHWVPRKKKLHSHGV